MKKLIVILSLILCMSCVAIAEEPTLTQAYGEEVRYDDVSGTTIYIGFAFPGTPTDEPEWRIMRMSYTGDDFNVEFADDDTEYDNIWDNRAALSY